MSDFTNQDHEIIEKLRTGLTASDPVPGTVGEFARASFSWRDIDASLAELSFDSASENVPAGVRSQTVERMLSFEVGKWTIDLEYNASTGAIIGAVSPHSPFTVELHSGGALFTDQCDDLGRFEFVGVEPGPASLVVRFGDGETLKTTWIVL